MQRLVQLGAVKKHTCNVTIVSLGGVKRLFELFSQRGAIGAAELVTEIASIKASCLGPPPLMHQPGLGSTAAGQLLAQEQDLQMDMQSEDENEDEDQDENENEDQDQDEGEAGANREGEGSRVREQLAPAPAGVIQQAMEFPSTIPRVYIQSDQRRLTYALLVVPRALKAEIEKFSEWSRAPINLERSTR